jgi:metal transporter CNNM
MFPLAWPVSKVLDYALGKELPTIYNKKGLARLVEMHKEFDEEAQLRDEEANIMRGALEFADRRVSEIMTKIDKVFTLDIHQKLDFDTMKLIYTSGYSRIPCFDRSSRLNETCAGVLLVKDLILVDPEDGIQVTTILNIYGRDTLYVFPDIKLAELLVLFKTGRSHLAVVRDVEERLDGDPRYVIRGIVTLEDVIEVIMKDKIEDEADVYFDKFDPNVLNIFNDVSDLMNDPL